MIIKTENIQQAIKEIRKSNDNKQIVVQAQDDNFNRKILEYGKFQVLLSPEKGERKNKLRQIDSGLNHVLAKIAKKNNIAIGIDFKEIKKLPKKEKAQRLAKIIQNIKICRKTKTKLALQNRKENSLLILTLGASTQQIKEAIDF
ncbi:MAG: hypothetical protein Q8P57_01200 [Candidatus Pacearchaeota archaeon]|nr:hypothetical protein [Candidatus Pacearchaeota archaeon]